MCTRVLDLSIPASVMKVLFSTKSLCDGSLSLCMSVHVDVYAMGPCSGNLVESGTFRLFRVSNATDPVSMAGLGKPIQSMYCSGKADSSNVFNQKASLSMLEP